MATFEAITTVCQAIIYLLQSDYEGSMRDAFNTPLEFDVYSADNFLSPMSAGVSLFLYRIIPNGTHRIPAGRIGPDGRRGQTQLPLDLHFMLTSWGRTASMQNTIAGWMMRVMEDSPILPVGLLDRAMPNVFSANETVELVLDELSTEDLMHIWETLPLEKYQLSVPYLARNVRIESPHMLRAGEPVQVRGFDLRKVENGTAD